MPVITKKIHLVKEAKKIFPKYLVKHLSENERICPVCNGLGMRIDDNIFRIKDDTSEVSRRELFPYKHQALSFCRSCYNGVQRLCPYCGQPYTDQSYMHCNCEGQKKADEEEKIRKWNEKVSKAVPVGEKDVDTMLYCEETDQYYWDSDEFMDSWYNEHDEEDTKPERLWVTSAEGISIDAGYVIESACEKLHEDAYDQCDESSLQKLLDHWCKEQTGATTYYPCYEKYVVIDWHKLSE